MFSLLLVLFATSSGFAVFSHLCLMSGDRDIATQEEATDCCASEPVPAEAVLSGDCCVEDVYFIKFDFTAKPQESQLAVYVVLTEIVFQETLLPIENNKALACAVYLPPPRDGNDRLAELSVFRI